MKRALTFTMIGVCLLAFQAPPASAGWGGLIRKGVSAAAKGSGKVVRKSATRSAAKAAGKGLTRVATKTGRKAATRVGVKATRAAAPGARMVANHLGLEGAQLLGRLTPRGSRQLAEISGELAKSPYRKQWMAAVAKHGDAAVTWLWKRKGSILCATAATTIALHPEEFMDSVEATTTAVTKQLTQYVAAPIAEEMAKQAAVTFPWQELWGMLSFLVAVGGGLLIWRWRSK